MTFGMPQKLTLRNLVATRAAAARLVAYLHLAVAACFLLLIQDSWRPTDHWLSWMALLALAALTFVNFRLGNSPWVALTLVLGILLVGVFLFDALRPPQRLWIEEVVLALPKIAVLSFSAGLRRPLSGFLGTVGAYLGIVVAAAVVSILNGVPPRLDVFTTLIFLVLLAIGIVGVVVQRLILPARAHIRAAEAEEAMTSQNESAASLAVAKIHDTFLNQLSAVAIEQAPQLSPALVAELRQGLEAFSGEGWLAEAVHAPAEQDYQHWLGSGVFHAISQARSRGLEVTLSGDILLIAGLDPERDRALGLAVRQCLLNVLRHAQTQQAEVTISAIDGMVTVVVADEGVGFDPETVAGDRLGLRHSVLRRVELVGGSVRVFSTPEVGTSVVLLVPGGRARAGGSGPVGEPDEEPAQEPERSAQSDRQGSARAPARPDASSLQRLDPLGTVVYWPLSLLASALIALLPIGVTVWRFSTGLAVGGPEQQAAVVGGAALAVVAALLFGLFTMPKYAPMRPSRMVLINLVLLASAAVAYWHYPDTRLVAGMSWGSLILALLFVGVAAYRPLKRLLVNTLGVTASVFLYTYLLAEFHLGMSRPILLAILSSYPILVVGLASWQFSKTALKQARQWQHSNLEHELSCATERDSAARRAVQSHWQERLGVEVVPFLEELLADTDAGERISNAQRLRARRLAEALRGVLVAETGARWYQGDLEPEVLKHLNVLDEIYTNPESIADNGGMRPSQRSALRAYLRFLLDHPQAHPETLRIRVSHERNGPKNQVEVRLRMMIDTGYAEFSVRAAVVYFLLRLEFPDVVAVFTRPILEVKFRYDKE